MARNKEMLLELARNDSGYSDEFLGIAHTADGIKIESGMDIYILGICPGYSEIEKQIVDKVHVGGRKLYYDLSEKPEDYNGYIGAKITGIYSTLENAEEARRLEKESGRWD